MSVVLHSFSFGGVITKVAAFSLKNDASHNAGPSCRLRRSGFRDTVVLERRLLSGSRVMAGVQLGYSGRPDVLSINGANCLQPSIRSFSIYAASSVDAGSGGGGCGVHP